MRVYLCAEIWSEALPLIYGSRITHRLRRSLASEPLAGSDLEWQWWRRGFDAARAEQADQVQAASAAAIAAAEERATAAERMRDQAWEEQQKCEEMLEHVVRKYLSVSDGERRVANIRAAHEHVLGLSKLRQLAKLTKKPLITFVGSSTLILRLIRPCMMSVRSYLMRGLVQWRMQGSPCLSSLKSQ